MLFSQLQFVDSLRQKIHGCTHLRITHPGADTQDGIAPPHGHGFPALDSLPGTFVDAAQVLVTLCRPDRLAVPGGDDVGRAVSHTQTAAVVTALSEEVFSVSGKFVEPKVDEHGLHSSQSAFADPVYLLLSLDLPGNLLQLRPGNGDLLADHSLVISVGVDDVVVGHHQAVTAAEEVKFRKPLHGVTGVPAAGIDTVGEGSGLEQLFRKAAMISGIPQA